MRLSAPLLLFATAPSTTSAFVVSPHAASSITPAARPSSQFRMSTVAAAAEQDSSTSSSSSSSAVTADVEDTNNQKLYGVSLDMPRTYVRCGRCHASFALRAEDLGTRGNGRRVACSVCDHSWYQSRDRLFDIKDGFELIPFPQLDLDRIGRNIAADRPADFMGRAKLYVGNLDFKCTEDDLYELFSTKGEVGDVSIAKDPTGRSRGFAFVTMMEKEGGKKAEELDGEELMGRNMNVREPNN